MYQYDCGSSCCKSAVVCRVQVRPAWQPIGGSAASARAVPRRVAAAGCSADGTLFSAGQARGDYHLFLHFLEVTSGIVAWRLSGAPRSIASGAPAFSVVQLCLMRSSSGWCWSVLFSGWQSACARCIIAHLQRLCCVQLPLLVLYYYFVGAVLVCLYRCTSVFVPTGAVLQDKAPLAGVTVGCCH